MTVLVVGAGPVGLTMACELARHGLAARIVDTPELVRVVAVLRRVLVRPDGDVGWRGARATDAGLRAHRAGVIAS